MASGAFAVSAVAPGFANAAMPAVNESELLNAGFQVLAATTTVEQDWVRSLPPGKIRAMQRNGKKWFVYPDASRNQIYVGGPQANEAYRQLRPERDEQGKKEADNRAYRLKQDDAMRKASARDLSNPYLGVTWADILY